MDPAMHCVMPIVLYTKVDAQCDKLAMVVNRTKPEFGKDFQTEVPLFLEVSALPYNRV